MNDRKRQKISEIIGNLDDNLIHDAISQPKAKQSKLWLKWGAAAASFALILGGGLMLLPDNKAEATNIGGVERYYKEDAAWQTESVARVWEWEYLTVSERYSTVHFNGKTYQTGKQIDAEYVGALLGIGEGEGYDTYTNQTYLQEFEIYAVQKLSTDAMVAAKMEDNYYICKETAYNPPATLGELLSDYALDETASITRFTQMEGYEEQGYYTIELEYQFTAKDAPIWEMIKACSDSPFVEDAQWSLAGREALSFTVSSDALGVYKHALYITKDGYLWTNFFDYGYLFFIGEDAANEIIDYTMSHAKEVDYAPYYETVAGVITEIGEGYILLDDTLLCEKPEEGIVYTITTVDPKIGRYIQSGTIDEDDFVAVDFVGKVLVNDEDYTITMVQSIQKAYLTDGDVVVME